MKAKMGDRETMSAALKGGSGQIRSGQDLNRRVVIAWIGGLFPFYHSKNMCFPFPVFWYSTALKIDFLFSMVFPQFFRFSVP